MILYFWRTIVSEIFFEPFAKMHRRRISVKGWQRIMKAFVGIIQEVDHEQKR